MKSVLPKLQKFGEEDGEDSEVPGGGSQSSRPKRNRPANKTGHRRPSDHTESPSTINFTCTNSVREGVSRTNVKTGIDRTSSKKGVPPPAAYEELQQLQSQWEAQNRRNPSDIRKFTLRGKGKLESAIPTENELTVLSIEGVPAQISGLALDGASEWMAVPWELPSHSDSSDQLSCLLLCKGVAKSQLPRVNIADWKPGSLGVPTFHCMRCFQRWMKKGGLPMSCSQNEVTTEGPAMCITLQTGNITEKEMLVGGILGDDGKPVKIRVEGPKTIKKLLKKERRKKLQRKKAKSKKIEDDDHTQDHKRQESQVEYDDDYSSDEDILDLPDVFKKEIMDKSTKGQKQQNRHDPSTVGEEMIINEITHMQESQSSSSSSFELSSSSDRSLSPVRDEDANQSNAAQHKRLKLPPKAQRNKQRAQQKKHNGETSQQSFSKINSSETCTSSSSSENQLGMLSLESNKKSKLHQTKKSTKPTNSKKVVEVGSAEQVLPVEGTKLDRSGNDNSMNTGRLRYKKKPQVIGSHSTLSESSSYSLHSQTSSVHSDYSDLRLPYITNSNSTNMVQAETSDEAKKRTSKKKTNSPVQSVKSSRKLKGTKSSNVHLPPLLGNTNSHSATSNRSLLKSSQSTNVGKESRPDSSEVSTHLPTLSQHKTNLVQQEMSHDWSTTNKDKHEQTMSSVVKSKHKSQNEKYTKVAHEITSKSETQQNSMGTAKSYRTTSVTKRGSFVEGNVAQTQSEHQSHSNQSSQPARNPSRSQTTSSSSIKPSQSASLKKPATKVSNAIVKQDVELKQRGTDSRTNQTRIRRKSKWGEEMPQVQASTSSHLPSSLVQMPNQKSTTSHTNIQRLPSYQDDIPRRFGQKTVNLKKSKKSESDQQFANYNSKDLGNVIGNSGGDGFGHDGGSRKSMSRNSVSQFERGDSSKQSLAARILRRTQQYQENNNVPMPIMGRGSSSNQNTRPASTGLGSRLPGKQVSSLIQDSTNTPQSLVRLKPLEAGNHTLTNDESEPAPVVEEKELLADQVCEANTEEVEKESEDSGLEDISEESEEEEEDEFDFEIPRPIPELKEISPMSFTSAYAFSFYQLNGPYRQVYNKTHARSLQPLRVGRRKRKPPKVRRKKVK